ncbi:MAG: type II secretion system protein [Planctomycetes bacterium]|nr:type II secretion system protein [Planctomycetota bacterium]
MRTALQSVRRAARAGFTLIELLAVIMIIGILTVFLLPRITDAVDAAKVTACKANMSEIYKGLMSYKNSLDKAPNQSGVKFFAEVVNKGILENTKAMAKKLTCPAVEIGSLPGIAGRPEVEWFKDLEAIDGTFSSYAGRDCKNFPLRKFPGSGKEALIADDNDPTMNHPHTTVVLMADGSVDTYELSLLRDSGVLGAEEEHLVVGPDSPVEELRKLSLD